MKDNEILKAINDYNYSPCGDCNYMASCDDCKMEINSSFKHKEISELKKININLLKEITNNRIIHISEISELKEKLKIAEDTIDEIIKSWESLIGNQNYTPEIVQSWLRVDMKPAIDKGREALSKIKEGE